MQAKCEEFVLNHLPGIRSLIAKLLSEKYSLTQNQIAEKMNLSQPAVSHYLRKARGKGVEALEKNETVMKKIEEITAEIAKENLDEKKLSSFLCEICKTIFGEKPCLE